MVIVMERMADLHTHSSASDGQYTPDELVQRAKDKEIEILSITDHDTVDGLNAAEKAATKAGILLLRGVELGAMEHKNLHLLGYHFSEDASNIKALCTVKQKNKELRNRRMIEFLRSKGIDLALEEVADIAGGTNISRPHFAQLMVKKGFVSTVREAFDRYLDTKEYDSIRVAKISARDCLDAVKADGGVVSLAHPYQLGYDDEMLRETVKKLADRGLDAIECFYPKHTTEQTAFYLKLARDFGLHVTGGSDFHGESVKPDVEMARVALDLAWIGIDPA